MFKERFEELINRDNTSLDDVERLQLFYTIACTDALYNRADRIYDFDNHQIKPSAFKRCQNSTEYDAMMLRRALHLYNSYLCKDVSTADLLDKLDYQNRLTVINAQLIYSRIRSISDIF